MAKNKIIILNGPPSCGKDCIGEALENNACWNVMTFKGGIFDALQALSEVSGSDLYTDLVLNYDDREVKETPGVVHPELSIRDIMIHTSEACMKALFGQDVFGKILAAKVRPGFDYVITDGGFEDEINALANEVCNTHDTIVFKIRRHDKGFGRDSRRYVKPCYTNCPIYELVHYEDQTEFAIKTINMILEDLYA